ncbi:MAG: peptidoglycan DD-metalloendopeptidase family protein [Oscillospiraceae bacterium]|nr:peptidoglycan DD-metalloendopeptidase family protein [Oscillospiraceae bacterium]
MKRYSIRSILSLVLALLMLLSMTASAFATEDEDNKKSEADSVRQEWNDLQNQIEAKREEMSDIEAELKKVQKDKANTQYEKTLLDQRNAALQAEINLLQEQMGVTEQCIAANLELEKEQTKLFHEQIRMEEERGVSSYWSVLFKATSFADLVSRIDFVNEIVEYERSIIDGLRDTRDQLAADRETLEQQNADMDAARDTLELKIADSMKLLADYTATEEGMQAEYDAIKAEADALDDLIAAAEQKAIELGLTDIVGTTGGYEWPCASIRWITSMFGGRKSPGGIGSTNHKGVDIGTPMRTPILAAKSGTVTWASWNGGYGECIIIYHGKGNSTLYGHLDNLSGSPYNVKLGDTVRQGDLIGWSGTSGNSTGPHLHFGIKENDTWVDPLNYLTGWHYYG